MPKRTVLLVLVMLTGVGVVLGTAMLGPGVFAVGSPPIDSRPPDSPVRSQSPDPGEPILVFGDHGWLQRTLTVDAVGETVTVELRVAWADGDGHVRVVGRDAAGRYEQVVTDEVRVGAELDAALAHYQRMYDELRSSGGSVEVEGSVTVAHQVIATPEGVAQDRWRIGLGDPDW